MKTNTDSKVVRNRINELKRLYARQSEEVAKPTGRLLSEPRCEPI